MRVLPIYDVLTEDFNRSVQTEATNASGIKVEANGFLRIEFLDGSVMILNGNLFRSVTLSHKEN